MSAPEGPGPHEGDEPLVRLQLVMLCEAANFSKHDTLNVLGEFDMLFAEADGPVAYACMLVYRLVGNGVDESTPHRAGVRLVDQDGNLLWTSPDFDITFKSPGGGLPARCTVMMALQPLTLPGHGSYVFEFFCDGQRLATGHDVHVAAPPIRPAPPTS